MSFRTVAAIGVGALVPLLLLAGVARADLTAFWRHNPITPEAIADDPALAGMQSWSLIVTNSEGGFVWAGMRATLPDDNHFYRNAFGGYFRPTAPDILAHPALEFHTYVNEPRTNIGGLVVLGGFPEPNPHSFGGPLDPIPGTFSVLWLDVFGLAHPPGTFEIARLTLPAGILPTVHPESRVVYSDPDQSVFVPTTIPEPVISALVLCAPTVWVLARRRLRPIPR